MTDAPAYEPPKVWTWDKENGGKFASINRPIAGATHDKELPVGRHPFQLYSLATPNGVKVTVMLEELLALGHKGAEYDAWLINIGFAQWIAALVWWEYCIRGGRAGFALMAPLAEGVIATCSTLSRSVGFLHVVPYLLALIEMHGWKQLLKTRKRKATAMGLLVLSVTIIAVVQVLRAQTYYGSPGVKSQFTRQAPADEPEAETEARYARHVRESMISQLPLLVTQRWVGLEAVLAVSSHPQVGPALFLSLIHISEPTRP